MVQIGDSDVKRLSNIKVAFVDFDDTLYIWDNLCQEVNEPEMDKTGVRKAVAGDYSFKRCRLNTALVEKLRKLKENGVKLYCLTWVDTSLGAELKQKRIDLDCPELEMKVIGAGRREVKVEVMREVASHMVIKANQVLLIDDLYITNEEARKANFIATTPLDIMTLED